MESQTDVVKIVPWDIPIPASYLRANELEDLHYSGSGLRIVLVEEELGRKWELMFRSVQAFRLTSEECALQVLSSFPKPGGFFEVINSDLQFSKFFFKAHNIFEPNFFLGHLSTSFKSHRNCGFLTTFTLRGKKPRLPVHCTGLAKR